MKTNETIKWQEEQALQRYQLIAPLLDESLDNAKRIQMREAIAEQNGLSPRTLYRYEAAYRKGGFPGLKPQGRETKRSPKLPENFDELLKPAIQLNAKAVGTILFGIIAAIVLGVGMCMVMVWHITLWGIVVGIAGILLLLCLIPMCKGLK